MMYIQVVGEKILGVSIVPKEGWIEIEENSELLLYPNRFIYENGIIKRKSYITVLLNNNSGVVNLTFYAYKANNELDINCNENFTMKLLKFTEQFDWDVFSIYNVNFVNGSATLQINDLSSGGYKIELDNIDKYWEPIFFEI